MQQWNSVDGSLSGGLIRSNASSSMCHYLIKIHKIHNIDVVVDGGLSVFMEGTTVKMDAGSRLYNDSF